MAQYSITPLNEEQLTFIWENMRDADRKEVSVSGWNDDNYKTMMEKATETYCGLAKDVPVIVFGFFETLHCLFFMFFGTNEADNWWFSITKGAKRYINGRLHDYLGKRGMVNVWDGHSEAIKWLGALGFEPTGVKFPLPDGTLILMEKK